MKDTDCAQLITNSGDRWEAICVKFDIAAQGVSFDDVRGHLIEASKAYLDDALTLSEDEHRRFLRRRAPVWVRLKLF